MDSERGYFLELELELRVSSTFILLYVFMEIYNNQCVISIDPPTHTHIMDMEMGNFP